MGESIMDQIEEDVQPSSGTARILVVGVGGGGGNAVQNMIELGLTGVEFVCANTDLQALKNNPAPMHLQLGEKLTRGLGAGANPDVGREAANESLQSIQQALSGAEMVFVTAGMGGGTGTGAAPIVAEAAKKNGALTVGVVTRPFGFEGAKRAAYARAGIEELSKHVDCLITIPNDRIMTFAPKKTPLRELMRKANDVLYFGVKGISDVITCPGYINLDFADVRTCMAVSGLALMGMGSGKGENRAEEAARSAITSPLLEDVSLSSAKAILYNITAPEDITGEEMELIGEKIRDEVPEDANIMAGVVFDKNLEDEIRVTVVATGIESSCVADPKPVIGNGTSRIPLNGGRLTPSAAPVQQPAAVQPLQSSERRRVQKVDFGAAQGYTEGEHGSEHSDFVRSASNRWLQEQRGSRINHEDFQPKPFGHPHNPGEPDFVFDDDIDVPAFIRKQAD